MELRSMLHSLINHSPDLSRLRNDGYDIEVRAGHLLVKHVPYTNCNRQVCFGTLISVLENDGSKTVPPTDHVVMFTGEFPCKSDGSKLGALVVDSGEWFIDQEFIAQHRFSHKPKDTGRYVDYFEKMSTYANQISSYAEAIDSTVTPRPHLPVTTDPQESPFNYIDSASARAGISAISQKLELAKVAIVGLGGTGSYVLDLVAKTPVQEIHLFDGDVFSSHNAFRTPGAASREELEKRPSKVAYLVEKYEVFRRGLIPHGYVDEENVELLRDMNFVFLCLDIGAAKVSIVEKLEEFKISFIDVGMGLLVEKNAITGILRVTTSTPEERGKKIVAVPDNNGLEDAYSTNIQVADLNALNAALAVIKWKKICGFYVDLEKENFSAYAIDGNHLVNNLDV